MSTQIAHYDDPDFFYPKYWENRAYEHASEEIALSRLLPPRGCQIAVDVGGGYGRLAHLLAARAEKVILVEPSQKQLNLAKKIHGSSLNYLKAFSNNIPMPSGSADLATLIRVSHHLPNLQPTLAEIFRILKPGGNLIIEIANSYNAKSRLVSRLRGEPISRLPIERRSLSSIRRRSIEFVNHHPLSVIRQLREQGFVINRTLSVSNFRLPLLKRLLPVPLLLALEKALQSPLSVLYFGPSLFFLCAKPRLGVDNQSNP